MAQASRAGQSRSGPKPVPDRTAPERSAVGPNGLRDQGQPSALVTEEQRGRDQPAVYGTVREEPYASSLPALPQDRERQGRGTAAPQQVAGLTEVCAGGGKVVCLSLVEAELAKLLGAPTEDVVRLTENSRLLRGCGVSRHSL
jgi:hypothetical protein